MRKPKYIPARSQVGGAQPAKRSSTDGSSGLEHRLNDSCGRWVPDPVPEGTTGYLLRESCSGPPPPACRALVPDEMLVPVAWTGDDCAGQCGKPCWPERFQSGIHRLVVTSCATPQERFEGPAFEMPGTGKALARLRSATDVAHVRAARVHGAGLELGAAASAPGRIAGLKEVSGTVQELGSELTAALLQWLRAERGFNDHVAKRCAPSVAVGFVLTYQVGDAGGTPQRTDLSVDVGCRALSIIKDGELYSYSYFDPSFQQLFGILRQVFPNDRELKRALDRQLDTPAPAPPGAPSTQ